MKGTLAALLAVALVAGWSVAADAAKSKRKLERREAHATRHHRARPKPFDENAYYERVLKFIPFGTPAWWRQLQDEFGHND